MTIAAQLGLSRHSAAAAALDRMAASPAEASAKAGAEKDFDLSQAGDLFMRGLGGGSAGPALVEPLDPYQQSLWFNKCVRAIARTCKGIPMRLARAGGGLKYSAKSFRAEICRQGPTALRAVAGCKAVSTGRAAPGEEIESGEAFDLLTRPNGYQDWPAFIYASIGWFVSRGRVAWILEGMEGRGNRPTAIHCVDGREIEPVMDRTPGGMPLLRGYLWTPRNSGLRIPLATDQVKYFVLWAGTANPLEGLAPSGPGRFAVATDYAASMFNAAMLSRNGRPGIHVDFPNALTEDQRAAFRQALRERYGGPGKAGGDLITEGGAKATAWETSFAELEFNEGKRTTRLEICALMDVPPFVAGWMDSAATDSSAFVSSARRQFYEDNIFPLLDGFSPALQELVSRFDPSAVVRFDVEDTPIVQEMRLARLQSAKDLAGMGYPVNMVNRKLNLGMEEVPWGDVGTLPSGLLPAPTVISGGGFDLTPEGPVPGAPTPEEIENEVQYPRSKIQSQTDELIERATRDRIWQSWARSWSPLASQLRVAVRDRLFGQERAVKAALTDEVQGPKSKVQGQETKVLDVNRIVMEVIRDPKARDAFRARMRNSLLDGRELGLRQALKESGLEGQALEDAMKRLLSNPRIEQAIRGESVIISTKLDTKVRQRVRAALEEGVAAGESQRELATRIEEYFGRRRGQAMMVARNVVGQSLSKARHEGQRSTGMTHKVWIHARNNSQHRPTHIEAEARYTRTPCPIDEPFQVGLAKLMYPRDASARMPGETVNCQCLSLARRLGEGELAAPHGILKAYQSSEFVTYADMLAARAAQGASHA